MHFQKRHVIGIVIVILGSFVMVECLRGGMGSPLTFDADGLMRVLSDFGAVVTITFFVAQLYVYLFWRFDPMRKIPVLKKEYTGTVAYLSKGKVSSLEIRINVKQTMNRVQLEMTTPLMRSRTLNGSFVEEKGMPVLYYVFNVEPRTVNPRSNEWRTGAARLIPNENGELEGYYWTDQGNQGRLYFYVTGALPANSIEHKAKHRTDTGPSDVSTGSVQGKEIKNVNTSIVRFSGQEKNNMTISSDPLLAKLLSCLQDISSKRQEYFSGLGIIVCDELLDGTRLISMRPGDDSVDGEIDMYTESGKEYLLSIADRRGEFHDGFILADEVGTIFKVSQYVRPLLLGVRPDSHRGTRSFCALGGSLIQGVVVIGTISEDGSIAIYKDGACVYDSRKSGD